MKLHPQPEAVAAAVVNLPNVRSTVDTVFAAIQLGIPLVRAEMLDALSIQTINGSVTPPPQAPARAVLALTEAPRLGGFNMTSTFANFLQITMSYRLHIIDKSSTYR